MRWLLLILLAACQTAGRAGGDDDGAGDDDDDAPIGEDAPPPGPSGVFDPAITDVVVEIDFETGQQPFTGPAVGFGDTFDIAVTNIDRLFAGKKTLVIPRVVGEMENVGAIADEELTVSDILEIAAQHRGQADSATRQTYYVLFVSGHFADANGPNTSVLGVSIGTTGVVAMFKDVIRGTGLGNTQRFVEQSTLVHELGHAIGLVDNGVALTSQHKDAAHGAHCSNRDCVMFFANEGASDMLQFVQNHVLAGNSILFADDCLADVDAVNGGP
jgi:hypothetical protein